MVRWTRSRGRGANSTSCGVRPSAKPVSPFAPPADAARDATIPRAATRERASRHRRCEQSRSVARRAAATPPLRCGATSRPARLRNRLPVRTVLLRAARPPLPRAGVGTGKASLSAASAMPTQQGYGGLLFDFNDGCRVVLPEGPPVAGAAQRSRSGNILFETELKTGRVNSTKRFRAFPVRGLAARRKCLRPRLFGRGPGGTDPVPGRHAGRHDGLVPLCGKIPGAPWLPAHLRDGGQLIPLFRDAYPDITFLTHEEVKPSELSTRPTASGCSSMTRTHLSALRLPPCRPASHRRLHSRASIRPRSRRASRSPDDSRAHSRALCLHRGAEHDPSQILEQSRRLARDRQVSKGGRLSRHLHRPEGACTAPASSGITFRMEPRTRPATARWRSGCAGSSTPNFLSGLSSGLSWLAWAVGTPVVMIQASPTDQRIRYALPGHQLSRLQQLLERLRHRFDHRGFSLVPAAQGHAAAVRVHAPYYPRARQSDDQAHSRIWLT